MAKKKTSVTRKKTTKKKAKKKTEAVLQSSEDAVMQRVNVHNCTAKPANAVVQGGGNKVRVLIPPMGHTVVKLPHAKSYTVNCWKNDPKKKIKGKVEPSGSAIFTGSKVHCTCPH